MYCIPGPALNGHWATFQWSRPIPLSLMVKLKFDIDMNDKNGKYYKIRRLKGVIMNIVFNGLSYNKMEDWLSE